MILELKYASFGYDSGQKLFENINLEVQKGDIVAILGPNGAGKTTLLRCMLGFLKWNEGQTLLLGKDIRDIPTKKLWKKIAYVPQAKGVATAFSVMEQVLLGRSSYIGVFSQPTQKDIEKAREVLKMLNIAHLENKKCSQISGGELQMVLIARALVAEPEVLVLDEPESNLDFKNQLIVLQTITYLASKGITCIFNTHYPAHALTYANKALMLSKGHGYMFGDSSKIVTEENIENIFGVKAVIGDIETDQKILRNVFAVSVSDGQLQKQEPIDIRSVAVISILTDDFNMGDRINAILHDYNKYLVGRMGIPYRKGGIYIINATLDAPKSVVESLAGRLTVLSGVSVKTTYANGKFDVEDKI